MLLWIDGFDAYGTSVGGAPAPAGVLARRYTVVTYESSFDVETGRLGGYCLEFGISAQYLTSPSLTTDATMVAGIAVKYPSWPNTATLLAFMDGNTLGMNIRVTPAGEIAVYRGSTLLATTNGAGLTLDGWYYIEFKVVCNASGSYELRINGVNKLSDSSVNTKAGSNNYHTAFRIGEITAITMAHAVDDFYCLDGSGSVNNDFLGNQKVVTIFPNGDVTDYQNFMPSAGVDHYALVDDNPINDDTDYVATSIQVVETVKGSGDPPTNEIQTITIIEGTGGTFTLTFDADTTDSLAYNISAEDLQAALEGLTTIGSGNVLVAGDAGGPYTVTFQGTLAATDVVMLVAQQTDLWDYGAISGLGAIAGLQINTHARETDAQNFTLKTVIKSDAVVDLDAGQVVGSTTYKSLRRVSETDPNTASVWTVAGINAAQFGVRVG